MAIKRPASVAAAATGEAQAKKKQRTGSVTVAKALKVANLPIDTKKMLVEAVKLCLTTFEDERHQYQKTILTMVEDSLAAIEAQLTASLVAAKEKVASLNEPGLQMALQQHAQARAVAKSTRANKEADSVEARMKYTSAEESYKLAMKEQKEGDFHHTELAVRKERFDALVSRVDVMTKCEEASTKKAATKLDTELKAFDIDITLIQTLHDLFTKPHANRGEFDNMTLGNLDEELEERRKTIEARLAELEPAKVSREEAVSAALHTYEASKAQLDAAKAAVTEAVAAVGLSENALQTTGEDIKNFAKHTKKAKDDQAAAEKALSDFQDGPNCIFQELTQMNKPLFAPEPEPAEQPEAAEPEQPGADAEP